MHGFGEFLFEVRQGFVGMLSIAVVLLGVAMALITLARWIRESALFKPGTVESAPLDAEFAEDFD